MASPYTADERAQILEILGVPANGTSLQLIEAQMDPGLAETFKPTYNIGDFSTWITQIDIQLATNTTEQATRARIHLAEWTAISPNKPLKVTSGVTGAGVLVDWEKQRANIRKHLASVIGIVMPWGTISDQAEQYYGKTRPQNIGDR
jgi:hypothetical protein